MEQTPKGACDRGVGSMRGRCGWAGGESRRTAKRSAGDGFGALLQREHDRLAAAVGPLHQQRRVQSPEPASQALLQLLLLSNREEAGLVVGFRRLVGREERERLTRVLDDQVLVPAVAEIGVGDLGQFFPTRALGLYDVGWTGRPGWIRRRHRVRRAGPPPRRPARNDRLYGLETSSSSHQGLSPLQDRTFETLISPEGLGRKLNRPPWDTLRPDRLRVSNEPSTQTLENRGFDVWEEEAKLVFCYVSNPSTSLSDSPNSRDQLRHAFTD